MAAAPWKKRALLLLALALAAALLLAWAPRAAAGGFEEEDDGSETMDAAVDLSVKAYKEVMASNDVWIVDYFQDDCPACMQIKPFMEQLAKDVYPFGIRVGTFDLKQSSAAHKLGVAAGLFKLPALKVFIGPPEKNPYTGKMFRNSVDYAFQEGAGLDTKALKRWVIKSVPSNVVRATTEEWPEVLEEAFKEEHRGVVMTLTDRETTPTLLKTLAIKYRDAFTFVEVPASETAFHEKFGVKKEDLAELFVLPAGKGGANTFKLDSPDAASAAVLFKGDLREPDTLQAFLDKYVVAKKPAPEEEAEKEEKAAKGKGKKEKKDEGEKKPEKPASWKELNATNFKAEVYRATDAWLVWLKPTPDATNADWEKHVTKSEGLFKVGVVDCADPANAKLCKAEGADASPFRAYPYGGDKEEEAKGFSAPAAAYQECGESLPDTLRRIGDGSNQMLVDQEINLAFGAYKFPIVIITNKPEPAALFKALALKFEPFLSFLLATSPSNQFLQRFNKAVVPSVHILIPQDMDLYRDVSNGLPAQHALRIESYLPGMMGPMNFLNLANFFVQLVAVRADPQRAQAMAQHLTGEGAAANNGGGSASAVPATVTEVTDAAAWAAACPASGAALCVVGLFRGGEQAPGVGEQVALLKEVAGKEGAGAERPWAFAWADGTCLAEFADAFDIQEPKLPTVVVYSPRKQRFANFKGTLSAPAVSEFLRGILSGSIPVAPVLREPRVDADTSRCTGLGTLEPAALEEAALEEEEDIGDLMAEILAEEKRKKEELAAALKRDAEEAKKLAEEAAAAADGEPKKKIVRRKKKKASDEL